MKHPKTEQGRLPHDKKNLSAHRTVPCASVLEEFMKNFKQLLGTVLISILGLFFLIWFCSLAKCEYLTYKYGDEFPYSSVQSYTMFRTPDYHKVIQYTDTTAKIYYVSHGRGGDVVYFKRERVGDAWSFDKWDTIWSGSGSAESFIWPYIR